MARALGADGRSETPFSLAKDGLRVALRVSPGARRKVLRVAGDGKELMRRIADRSRR